MSRVMHTWSLTCAAAALLVFNTFAAAQTSTAQQTATAPAQLAATENAGQALMEARKSLNAVLNTPAPNKAAFDALNEIKSHYMELEKAYSARGDWQTPFAALNQRIAELVDGPTATGTAPTSTATTGATGTSGTMATARLDPAALNHLQAFRKALNAFSQAMGGGSASPSSATPGATGTTGTTATSGASSSSTSVASTAAPPAAGTDTHPHTGTATAGTAPATAGADPHVAEMARLIALALSSTATSAGADTVCVDRKTLQDLHTHITQMQAGRKPQD